MPFQDHLRFYLKNRISPVRQDISDLQRHLERRESLYRRLGVPRQFIRGRTVLEVGPGSGHNSLYVSSSLPKKLDLVEPNPVGRAGIDKLYQSFNLEHTPPKLIKKDLETFDWDFEYDLAIAEAWLGSVNHELELIKKLSTKVKVGGILILTLQSPVGMLANVLRRILAYELVGGMADIHRQTEILIEAFGTHLSSMQAMSRLQEDWIQDNLLNPAALTSVLTPATLLETLPNFDVYETYPKFMTDWRWYKELTGERKSLNQVLLECWRNQTHNFFNMHSPATPEPLNKKFNDTLEAESQNLINFLIDCESRGVKPDKGDCLQAIKRVFNLLARTNHSDAQSISELIEIYEKPKIRPKDVSGLQSFGKVFGRELVYISLIRTQ